MKQIVRFVVAALCLLPLVSSAQDVGISSIESPVSCGSRSLRVVVKIKNQSGAGVSNIPVTIVVSGAGSANVSGTYAKTLAANSTDTFSLGTGINAASGGTYTIKAYTALSTDINRGNDTLSVTRGLNAIPTAAFSKSTTTVCRGKSISFTNSSTGASSYKWYFGEGSTSLANNPTHTFNKAGTFTVSLVAFNSSCRDSVTTSVTILNNPGGSKILQGTPFHGYFYSGAPNDPDLSCVGDTLTYEIPAPSGFSNATYGSSWQLTHSIKSASTGASAGNNTFTAPASGKNAYITFKPSISNADVTYILLVTVTNKITGCDSVMTHYISVNSTPTADFTFNGTCLGDPTYFKDAATIPPGLVVRRYEFGEGTAFSSTANPTYTYKNAGTFTVKYTVTSKGGCEDVITKQITINPKPVAKFSTPANACAGNPVKFTNQSTSTGGPISSRTWTIIEGGVSKTYTDTHAVHTFSAPGKYKVSLEVSTGGGCVSIVSDSVNIAGGPVASFPQPVGCLREDITFTSTSQNASTFIWAFSDGDTLYGSTVKRQFLYPSAYKVSLIAVSSTGCRAVMERNVNFFPQPVVKFTNTQACANQTITFTDATTIAGGGSPTAWLWKFEDGTKFTTNKVTKTFATAGQKRVTLVVTSNNGCKDSIIQNIEVKAAPVAGFTAPANTCVDDRVDFVSTSTNSTSYMWTLGDGNSATTKDVQHTYDTPGTYEVKLVTTNSSGCKDSTTKTVVVGAGPDVEFKWCADGRKVTFEPTVKGLNSYSWTFGDALGGTSDIEKPTYSYLSANGEYDVTLTVTDATGCENSFTAKVGTGFLNNSNNCKVGIEDMNAANIGLQVYPNPFSGRATLAYSIDKATRVSINMYDATGKEAGQLVNEMQGAGDHQIQIDGNELNLKPGVYLIRVNMDGVNYYSNLIYKN